MADAGQDGDRSFVGVDARRDPGELEPGLVASAVNYDFTNNELEPRRGFVAPRGLAARAFDFPFSFPFNFSRIVGHGTVYGGMPFTDRVGVRFIIILLERYGLKIHESSTITPLRYPQGVTITDRVTMRQAFDKVFIFRGKSYDPLYWDGVDDNDIQLVPRTDLGDGVLPMPRSSVAEYFLDTLFVLDDRDQLLFSDIGAPFRYSISNQFKIDSGSFDTVTKVLPFGQRGIIVAKENSMDFIDNLVGDIVDNARRTRLSNSIGCGAPDTMVDVGADVWFMSERGVYSILQALDNQLQADATPLSIPIDPVFRRINWQQKKNFRAVWWDNKYILAVALDDSILNNALIVYSFITKTWHGYHTADFFDADRLFTLTVNDISQLFAVSSEGVIYRLYVTFEDDPLTGVQGISGQVYTRGYGGSDMDRKKFQRIQIDVNEWAPNYSIKVIADGKNEEQELGSITRDRTRYHTMFAGRYDVTNVNDDHGAPYRQDYSVLFNPKTFDFPFSFPLNFRGAALPGGVYDLNLGSGINFNAHQRVEIKKIVNRSGDYMQVCIEQESGRAVVHAVKAEFRERYKSNLTRS